MDLSLVLLDPKRYPEILGDIRVQLRQSAVAELETCIRVADGEDDAWEPPVTFRKKDEDKLRNRLDTPKIGRPDNSTPGDELLSAPPVDREFGVVLCDVSSGSGVFDRISEAHGDELMLRALDLRRRGHPDKASYLLQLFMEIVQVESVGQNRQN